MLMTSNAPAQSTIYGRRGLEFKEDHGILRIHAVSDDVLSVRFVPNGVVERITPVLDPKGLRTAKAVGNAHGAEINTRKMSVAVDVPGVNIIATDGSTSIEIDREALTRGIVRIRHANNENLYGMRSIGLGKADDPRLVAKFGMFRNSGAPIAAGSQGDGGAPLAYSTTWGLLVDSIDGEFTNKKGVLEFTGCSQKGVEAYIFMGPPKRTIEAVTALTGRPPMSPKWALGFMNSQWGITEKQAFEIVGEYRKRNIPFDAFILDFDFKAWGEDNYGEWRWNSTKGPGSVSPIKFPNGESGRFGKAMLDEGVHVVGIMKPRILTQNVDLKPTQAAAEATAHRWWMPGRKPYKDYFSGRLANDLDFSKPSLRKWYWKHAQGLFDTGISGWWNDEADDKFGSLGHFQMQQSLFEGQTGISERRVWSLNRNFYLGAQRYAYGTWSGDIRTGFKSMADQRARMLTMINLAQPHWSMDAGGFSGKPNPENYARWIQFAAMVPVMRVHGSFKQLRQPWVYGPTAEAAATNVINLRYALFPTLYSLEYQAHQTGVGMVRPLFWEFPGDPQSANVVDSWLIGDSLLTSPVVEEGQTSKEVYLPPGVWFDYHSDRTYQGGQTVLISTDSVNWSDLPLFVREGAIVATQPVVQHLSGVSPSEITLDYWPGKRTSEFTVYDDDGETTAAQRGEYFSQAIHVRSEGRLDFARPTGTYRSPIRKYRLRVHGKASSVTLNGIQSTLIGKGNCSEIEMDAGRATNVVINVTKASGLS